MTIYAGTSGFSYKPWKGRFYPRGLATSQMLRFYAEQLPTVEINNTFKTLPDESAVKAWAHYVPAGFKFAIKAPQRITHFQRLKNSADSVSELLEMAGLLKTRLGPLLFQLPPTFKKDAPRLREFLKLLPRRRRTAIEFRHPSWFDEEIYKLLRDHGAALCIADAENDLNVPFVATADWGYLRLRRDNYSAANLKSWAKRVRNQDWQDTFVFFKHEDTGAGPAFAKKFLEFTSRL
jgi:uncharacterized protein YecE (DUF72 family)